MIYVESVASIVCGKKRAFFNSFDPAFPVYLSLTSRRWIHTAWKNSWFILSERSDFLMINNLSAVHAFVRCMLTLLSVDEILLPKYLNWSSKIQRLAAWSEDVFFLFETCYIYVHVEVSVSCWLLLTMLKGFGLGICICIKSIKRQVPLTITKQQPYGHLHHISLTNQSKQDMLGTIVEVIYLSLPPTRQDLTQGIFYSGGFRHNG